MIREDFIKIVNNHIANKVTVQEVASVIVDFCMEKDPSKKDLIEQCTAITLQNGIWKEYFDVACNYYFLKFNVCLLYDKEQEVTINTPLGPRQTTKRVLLQVY